MKTNFLRNLFVIAIFLSIFSACDLFDKNTDTIPTDQYLVSYDIEKSYLPAFIKGILEPFANDYPEMEPIISKLEYGVTVYKISYKTSFDGEEILASGLVSIPISVGEFPVLSYQNGTNTLHSNAPSVNPDNELFLLLEFMASTGFVVTIPDYLGFGSSDNMFHPYLDKESTVQSIIDMQHAVKELVANYLDVDLNGDYYIAGYSQGGWSTMQLQKAIEKDFSDVFNLRASACGAGPYNLNYINEYVLGLDEYPMPYFLGYIFNSYYNLEGITTPINEVFQEPYDARIPILYDGTKASEEINNQLTIKIPHLFTEDYVSNYKTDTKYSSIIDMLTINSVEAWKTTTPTMLLHGTEDTFVPPMGSNRMFAEFQLQGVGVNDVVLIPLPGKNHQTGIIPASIASISWFLEIKDEE